MFSIVAQAVIACTGGVAIFLTQSGRPSRARWACCFGLAGQPAWFYSAFTAHQWGILGMTLLYTFAWGKGIYTFWWLPYRVRRRVLCTFGAYTGDTYCQCFHCRTQRNIDATTKRRR